jgi:hypothetical protein
MRRSLLRVLCVAGGVAAAGCADHGTYTLKWTFIGGTDPAIDCGKHGVDSVRVIGMNTGGDGETFAALCTDGGVTHSVPVGNWTLGVHQVDVRGLPIAPLTLDDQGQVVLDADGHPIPAPDPTATGDVAKDRTMPLDPEPVVLTPRPECSDGVDNDGDGRVDVDDPDCMGDPNRTAE